jgi:antagonist of KipI
VTLLGPELRFDESALIAVAGADLEAAIDDKRVELDTPHRVESGRILRFGARRSGTRAYIAIDGGIDVPLVLGSRSTHVVSGLGGIDGRPLRAGDRVPLCTHLQHESNHPWRKTSRFAPRVIGPSANRGARRRAMRGPQDYYFEESAFDWLAATRFAISPQSDRMGYRLVPGSRIPNPSRLRSGQAESRIPTGVMISDAAFTGGIQIPPSGEPILLMADRQTTGGYPQIATVITADLRLAGQLAPGEWIEFAWCSRTEAIAALKEQEEAFGAG